MRTALKTKTISNIFYKKITSLTILTLFITGLFGLFSFNSYNILPANIILETVFVILSILLIKKTQKKDIYIATISALYILFSYAIASFTKNNALDFLLIYKAYIYIIFLSLYINKEIYTKESIRFLFFALLLFLLVKYSYSRALNLSDRPGLYTENNFELILLIILYYLTSINFSKNNLFYFAIITMIVVLSGSRSGFLALICVYFFVFIKDINYKTLISFFILLIIISIAYYLFLERLGGGTIEDIDRYKFLMVFLSEIENWNIINYAFGSKPITPLHFNSCSYLGYYQSLFSYSGDGSCYSVILHSYLIRAFFDHGLIGALTPFLFIWYALHKVGYTKKQTTCLILIIILSGFSVSALNSIYVAIALSIAFSFKKDISNECY